MIKTAFRLIIPLFLSITASLAAQSQATAPGGVKDISVWYATGIQQGKAGYITLLPGSNSFIPVHNAPATAIQQLNFRNALCFAENSSASIPLGAADFSKISLFTVHRPENISAENILWYTTKNNVPELVLTTSRMADIVAYRYMNFTDLFPLHPKVNTYIQQKESDSLPPTEQSWNMGARPMNPQLPIVNFTGAIPEIIAYQRVLNGEELLRVATYLALKYGVTLTEPGATYLNSSGQTIWDGNSYPQYHNNIAGLVRDDSSGLYQPTAASSNQPGLLTVSTADSLPANSFLLWGDNDALLMNEDKQPGAPVMLQRKWMTVPTGFPATLKTTLVLDTRQLDVPQPAIPVYWLAIDSTGKGNFSAPWVQFKPATEVNSKGQALFSNVLWNSSKTVFGFAGAQSLLAGIYITQPSCTQTLTGKLSITIWGGTAPFRIRISRQEQLLAETTVNNARYEMANLMAGRYKVQVTDKNGNRYEDAFYINNEDGPRPVSLLPAYTIQEGSRLILDAEQEMPAGTSYHWSGPGNFTATQPGISITAAGVYTLTTTLNGCSFVTEIIVKHVPKNAFTGILLYPNPSKGLFTGKVSIDKPAPLYMDIFTEAGNLVLTRRWSGFANYTFSEQLFTPGAYMVVFRSGLSRETRKLIITR